MKHLTVIAILLLGASTVRAEEMLTPALDSAQIEEWEFGEGTWRMADGILEQSDTERLTTAFLREPAFGDFQLTAEFRICAEGSGVRAAAVILRATGTRTYYWLHLDSLHGNAILTRSTPGNAWIEILRRPVEIPQDAWHTVQVSCLGSQIDVSLNGQQVLQASDQALSHGRLGFGTSEGQVAYRNVRVEGIRAELSEPWRKERPLHQIISRGEAAGSYQAFPDACRLPNGDILCVFYGGYGHVSLPSADWPRGGRICLVRSSDEGVTWTEPRVLFDGPEDDRDPHIAAMRDGTLYCTFFTYRSSDGKVSYDASLVSSCDGGETWSGEATLLARQWACSAPVRELSDGTRLLGVYTEAKGTAYGGVLRSTDQGRTWSEPIPIQPESGVRLDAETDFVQLTDGTVFAALRGDGQVNMHFTRSSDLGVTWSPVQDSGFLGHCPHLTRLSTGEILLVHRLPHTSMHISRDDATTWQGPILIDEVIGAYPSTVELNDRSVLIVYYEEGVGSAIRAMRIRVTPDGIVKLP
ncbi:MAG: exo-alpha-sialidase [Pirellulaceae bacterium]